MELDVFNIDTFERLGTIDVYQKVEFKTNYRDHNKLDLTVDATAENIDWLIKQGDDIFLTKAGDYTQGYLVESFKYTDETNTSIDVYCKSLSSMLSWRQIDGQQTFRGNVEDVLRSFVNTNAINPTNIKRKITNLVLGPLSGINITTEESYANKVLDESLWEICIKYDISYDILLDIKNKQFQFVVWQGTDRSTEQSDHDAIIFAKEFDNVLSQNYTDDKSNFKNTVIIAGEGEGTTRTYLVVGDENSGRHRREMFVDARDLQSDNNDETTMTQAQYEALLRERAKSKQAENQRVQAYESDIEYNSQFKFGIDYFIGDKVTNRNDEIGIVLHTRVVTATETFNQDGYDLKTEFGSNVPTLLSKLKKAVNS